MLAATHTQRVLNLASQKGLLRAIDLDAIDAPRVVLTRLTTQLPRQIWIAMPRGSHVPRIGYPPVKMVQMTGDVYMAGVEEHLRDGVKLRVYGAAKTVVDCFKHRNKIGLDVAL